MENNITDQFLKNYCKFKMGKEFDYQHHADQSL